MKTKEYTAVFLFSFGGGTVAVTMPLTIIYYLNPSFMGILLIISITLGIAISLIGNHMFGNLKNE